VRYCDTVIENTAYFATFGSMCIVVHAGNYMMTVLLKLV